MGRFIARPAITFDNRGYARRPWVLETAGVYRTASGDLIKIPANYRTDLASVPRIPGLYWRFGNRAILASIIHDYLYEYDPYGWGRKRADQIFWEIMASEKEPPWWTTRWAMYMGVRLGGWGAWWKYRKA